MSCNYKTNIKDIQSKYTFKIFCAGGTGHIEEEIGDLSQLTTTAKDNLVNAINEVDGDLSAKEDKSNKVTTITSSSTDTQYPSAKAVYDEAIKPFDEYRSKEIERNFDWYFNMTPDTGIYGVKWQKWADSQDPGCTKYGANTGLSITPATRTTREVSTYGPAFDSWRVNAFKDNDGYIHLTAVEGDENYGDTEDTIKSITYKGTTYLQDVYSLKRAYYEKWYVNDDGWQCYERTFAKTNGFTLIDLATQKDGDHRYFLQTAFVCGYDSQDRYRSLANLVPGAQRNTVVGNCSKSMLNAYNNQISNFATRGYYTGMLGSEWKDILTTFWLKYGTRNTQSIFSGCTGYDYQYTNTLAENNVSRIRIKTSEANNLVVGSSVSIGDNFTTPTSYDRVNGYVHRWADSVTITSIEADSNDNTYSYVNLDCEVFTSTSTTFLKTMPWRSGFSNNILGKDGQYANNSKCGFVMDGIELMVGGYEILCNAFMDVTNSGYNRDIYITRDKSKLTTTVATAKQTYNKSSYSTGVTTLNAWNYITEMQLDLINGIAVQTSAGETGSSSSKGYCDGLYHDTGTSGQREFPLFGTLSNWSASGLSCLSADYGLTFTGWHSLSRLSINAL